MVPHDLQSLCHIRKKNKTLPTYYFLVGRATMKKQLLLFLFALVVFPLSTFAQTFTVSGTVVDANSDPLPGANVLIRGTQIGTAAAGDGYFRLANVPAGDYELRVSFVGYSPQMVPVNVNGDIDVGTITLTDIAFGGEVLVQANRAQERETPVSFSNVSRDEIDRKYTTQDVPQLLEAVPGVFTSTSGLGEAEISMRGIDAERIQIMINGVPVNDPESQVVYWSNWSGLSSAASSIQVQRGVGASLVGSGAFGGSVNIETGLYSMQPRLQLRSSVGGYVTDGVGNDSRLSADGTGGFQNYTPFQQSLGIEYATGQLYGGKLNMLFKYERKSGDSYQRGTNYNGHSFYFGAQSILNNHLLTFNIISAPQRHNQARATSDLDLIPTLGREYNRNLHPYQENYYHKPQFELHWDWKISDRQTLKTNSFMTFGSGGGRYLRNDFFDVETGFNGFLEIDPATDRKYFGRHARFIYETAGKVLQGYNPETQEYTYAGETEAVSRPSNLISSSFNHSWRNDSQNNHQQFGMNTSYSHTLNQVFRFVLGGEARHWRAAHYAESFDFRQTNLATSDPLIIQEVQRRYDYDGIVTNMSAFARLLIFPVPQMSVMLDGQYARYNSKVEEAPIRIYDFGAGTFTGDTYLATRDLKDENGNPLFTDDQYERTFNFFMPKVGVNYNINERLNVYGNYSISKKEPKTGDWYDRDDGPGANQLDSNGNLVDLKEETLNNAELGISYRTPVIAVTVNGYYMDFQDRIEGTTNQEGDRLTINAGNSEHLGVEMAVNGQVRSFDYMVSATVSNSEWKEMSVQEIFGEDAAEVIGKKVPFAPQNQYFAEIGYRFNKNWRFALSARHWVKYYGNYTNTARLPNFFSLNSNLSYATSLAGSDVMVRLGLYNMTNRKNNYERAAWDRDFNRNDDLAGEYNMYVVPGRLFSAFLTASITL